MNLQALAESDLSETLEDTENGGAVAFTLSDAAGRKYELAGTVGDIGFLLDAEGVPVSGRSIVAAFRLSSLSADGTVSPDRGWTVSYTDMRGVAWTLYVIWFEPDRTIGIGRLILSLQLEKETK